MCQEEKGGIHNSETDGDRYYQRALWSGERLIKGIRRMIFLEYFVQPGRV